MSRSRKKPIIKDKGCGGKIYRKIIRRSINNDLKNQLQLNDLDELELKDPKNIINDYTRCDWILDYEYTLKSNNHLNCSQNIFDEATIKAKRK